MASFVDVLVEEHDELPEGCSMRFQAEGEGRPVERVAYESETGVAGTFHVEGRRAGGAAVGATAYEVKDSSAGTSVLVVGGERGLRLRSLATGETFAEPYLLLAPSAVLG
ncbi:MAG TPA: hypothetical protein VFS43_36090 [Polyangiaceae bacterium]|nr:hypothetical protein [Polyangiaceae bacterium]